MARATIVVEGTFRPGYETFFHEYSQSVRLYLNQLGAEVIRRQLIERTLYGKRRPSLIMLIDFPSVEVAAQAFFAPGYQALIPLRDKVFSEFNMYLATFGEV